MGDTRKPRLTDRILDDLAATLEIGRSTIESDLEGAHGSDLRPCDRAIAWVDAMRRWKLERKKASS